MHPTIRSSGSTDLALVVGTGTSFTATYTVVGSAVNEGECGISIVFRDLASNAGADVTSVTDGSVVVIDLTPPTLPTVTIESDNVADSTKANAGDRISVSMSFSETVLPPVVMVAGRMASLQGSFSSFQQGSSDWTATIMVDNTMSDGLTTFSVLANDMASNQGAIVTTASDESRVTVDLTRPILTSVSIVSNNANDATRARVSYDISQHRPRKLDVPRGSGRANTYSPLSRAMTDTGDTAAAAAARISCREVCMAGRCLRIALSQSWQPRWRNSWIECTALGQRGARAGGYEVGPQGAGARAQGPAGRRGTGTAVEHLH